MRTLIIVLLLGSVSLGQNHWNWVRSLKDFPATSGRVEVWGTVKDKKGDTFLVSDGVNAVRVTCSNNMVKCIGLVDGDRGRFRGVKICQVEDPVSRRPKYTQVLWLIEMVLER